MTTPEYCLLWIEWWPFCMSKAEWSGWVQAIGSIGAIYFAGSIARSQIKAAARVAASERLENAMVMEAAIGALANQVLQEVQTIALIFELDRNARDFGRRHSAESLFLEAEQSLSTIPMQQLPSGAAVNRLVGLLKCIKTARNTYRSVMVDLNSVRSDVAGQAKMNSCAMMVAAVKSDCDRALKHMRDTGTVDTENRAA